MREVSSGTHAGGGYLRHPYYSRLAMHLDDPFKEGIEETQEGFNGYSRRRYLDDPFKEGIEEIQGGFTGYSRRR